MKKWSIKHRIYRKICTESCVCKCTERGEAQIASSQSTEIWYNKHSEKKHRREMQDSIKSNYEKVKDYEQKTNYSNDC